MTNSNMHQFSYPIKTDHDKFLFLFQIHLSLVPPYTIPSLYNISNQTRDLFSAHTFLSLHLWSSFFFYFSHWAFSFLKMHLALFITLTQPWIVYLSFQSERRKTGIYGGINCNIFFSFCAELDFKFNLFCYARHIQQIT